MTIPMSAERRAFKTDSISALFSLTMDEQECPKWHDILRLGEISEACHLLISGYACRYRILKDGRRQITAFLVPGDICDLYAFESGPATTAVTTITPCKLGKVSNAEFGDNATRSGVTASLLRRLRRDDAILHEWMVSLGRRSAIEALAHLFCEMRERSAMIGLADGDDFPLPICQTDLADALGLTSVHINRTLQHMRKSGLVDLKKGTLIIYDRSALEKLANFDPAYLLN